MGINSWSRDCSGGMLFSFVEALTLKQYVNSEEFRNAKVSYPDKKEELKKLADSLDKTDNPVLIIVKASTIVIIVLSSFVVKGKMSGPPSRSLVMPCPRLNNTRKLFFFEPIKP